MDFVTAGFERPDFYGIESELFRGLDLQVEFLVRCICRGGIAGFDLDFNLFEECRESVRIPYGNP